MDTYLSTLSPTLNPQSPTLTPQSSILSTQHSALSTQHSVFTPVFSGQRRADKIEVLGAQDAALGGEVAARLAFVAETGDHACHAGVGENVRVTAVLLS